MPTDDGGGGPLPVDAEEEYLPDQRPTKKRVEAESLSERQQFVIEQKYESIDVERLGKAVDLITDLLYPPGEDDGRFHAIAVPEALQEAAETMLRTTMEYVADHFRRAMTL